MSAVSKVLERLAQQVFATSRRLDSVARSEQLSSTSVYLDDGSDQDIVDGIQMGTDASAGVVVLDDQYVDLDNSNDFTVDDSVAMPERMDQYGLSGLMAVEMATAAAMRVNTAQAAADAAADTAANAQTTADGKNARRRGQTQPAPPPGGWVQGDQWVVDNALGAPVEVRVWDGTQFVPEQTLASDILVLGPDGAVRIKDSKVTAPAIAVGALDFKVARGMEISSGRFVGGEFELADHTQDEQTWAHQCDTLTGTEYSGGVLTLDSSRKHSGSASIRMPDGSKVLGFPVPNKSASISSVWVYSEVEATVQFHAWELSGFEPSEMRVPAGVWTEVTTEHPASPGTVAPVSYVSINTLSPFPLWVDQVETRILTVDTSSGLKLFRSPEGTAMLESINDGNRTRVMGGGIYFDNNNNPNHGLSSIGPWGFTSYDSNSRLRIAKENSSPGVGITLHAGSSPSQSAGIGITGYGSSIVLDAENVSYRGDQPWTDVSPVSPFALYTSGSTIRAMRSGGMVTITGVLTCNTAGHLAGTTNRHMLNLPEWAKPWRTFYGRIQGSGSDSFYMTAGSDGVWGCRYTGTQGTGVWLPFSITYPGKPI